MKHNFISLWVGGVFLISSPVFAEDADTVGAYRDCIKNLDAVIDGHVVRGGPNEISENIQFGRGAGFAEPVYGLTPVFDPAGDGKTVYFVAYGKFYKAKTGVKMPGKPSEPNGITSTVKFLKVKSPINGKLVYFMVSASNFGPTNENPAVMNTNVRVSSNRVPLALNTDSAPSKNSIAVDLEQVGESEATPFIERQINAVLGEMPKSYSDWLSDLKRKSTIVPSDPEYTETFRGSDAENVAFQESLKREYAKILKAGYFEGLFPDCRKLKSKSVSGTLSEAIRKSESLRVKYAGGSGSSTGGYGSALNSKSGN
jgi:hypothetical protein